MIAGFRTAAVAAAGVLAVFVGLLVAAVDTTVGAAVVDGLLLISAALATAACTVAARAVGDRSRLLWWLLAATMLSLTVAQGAAAVVHATGSIGMLRTVVDSAYLLARPFGVAAAASILLIPTGAATRLRAGMDALMIAAALLFVGWPTVLATTVPESVGTLSTALDVVAPFGDLLMLAIVAATLSRARLDSRVTLALLALAPALWVVGSLTVDLQGVARLVTLRGGAVAGALVVTLAALSPGRDLSGSVDNEGPTNRFGIMLPYLPALLAVAAAATGLVTQGEMTLFSFWNLIALVLLVLGRQFLTLLQNRQLALHLEATVDERTATLREREAQLRHQVLHDPLTGLANRRLLRERIDQALLRSRRTGEPLAVLLLDVDDFKTVNDSLGHLAGDLLLTALARRVVDCFDTSATCARLGGDEFAVLLEATTPADGVRFARRLLAVLDEPFAIEGRQLRASASIGLANSAGRETAAELIRNADLALYQAKAAGKRRCAVFEDEMHERMVDRLELGNDLRDAVIDDQLFLLYQPLIDLVTDEIVGVESLVRWRHPRRGVIPPGEFVELAEDEGTVVEIGAWVLRESCRQVKAWDTFGKLRVNVNVSPRQLQEPGLVELVRKTLADTDLPPERLVLEITESALVADLPIVSATLSELRAMGILIALDDFGTGSSSLSHLRRFPVGMLKVDKSFSDGLGGLHGEGRLAAAVLQMAHTLGLETVAEGIERPEQLAAAKELGCNLGQGYLMAKPLDPFTISQLLRGSGEDSHPVEAVAAGR